MNSPSISSSLSISSSSKKDNNDDIDISSFATLVKKTRVVKYSKLFDQKMSNREAKKDLEEQERQLEFKQIAASRIIGHRIIKFAKKKIYDKTFSCRTTLLNIRKPQNLSEWYSFNGYRSFCVFCDRPAIHDIVGCKFCSSVIHLSCLVKEVEEILKNSSQSNLEEDSFDMTNSMFESISIIEPENDHNNNNLNQNIDNNENNEMNNIDDVKDSEIIETNTGENDIGENDDGFSLEKSNTASIENDSTIIKIDDPVTHSIENNKLIIEENNHEDKYYEPYTSAFSSNDDALGYVCYLCRDGYAEDKAHYEKVMSNLKAQEKLKKANNFICKRIFTYAEIIRLRKHKAGITLVQSMLRRKKARHNFYLWQRAQLRVFILEFELKNERILKHPGLVTITVIDPITHQQIFRYDRTPEEANNESILIPGMTAYMDASTKTYNFYKQASVYLRDVEYFYEKKTFELTFASKVQWAPEVVKDETSVNILLPGVAYHPKVDNRAESRLDTRGESRVGRKVKENDSFISGEFTNVDNFISIDEDTNTNNNLNTTSSVSNTDNEDTIILIYNPLNIVASLAQGVIAPPVDLLRKPADVYVANQKDITTANSQQGRTTQWWICLANMKLYFYQSFGDSRARYVSDLSHANVYAGKNLTNNFLATIVHADKRAWTLEFNSPFYAQKFEFATMETKKFWDTGNSKYFRTVPKFKKINWKT